LQVVVAAELPMTVVAAAVLVDTGHLLELLVVVHPLKHR